MFRHGVTFISGGLGVDTVVWLVSSPLSMFVGQKMLRNPHNKAEAKNGYLLVCAF
jgi:hypothetical protein